MNEEEAERTSFGLLNCQDSGPTWLPRSDQELAFIEGLLGLRNGLLRMSHPFLGNSDPFLGSATSGTYHMTHPQGLPWG